MFLSKKELFWYVFTLMHFCRTHIIAQSQFFCNYIPRIIYLIVSGHACIDIKLTSLYYTTSWTYGPCSFPARIKNENTVTTEYVEKCCLSAEEYTLTCKDSEKMGWRGGYLEIQGHRHCHDFFIGYADRRKLSVRGRH